MGTTISYNGTFSHGLNALGARSAADATVLLPLSRQGADAAFNKLDGRVDVMQALPENFFVSVGAAGQTSFNRALQTSEQFVIVGSNALSGFTAGALSGDAAWVARGELGQTTSLPIGGAAVALVPYCFAALGERRYQMPTVLEFGSIQATNYGAGLRFQLSPPSDDMPNTSGFVEFSRRRASDPSLGGWMLLAGGSLRY